MLFLFPFFPFLFLYPLCRTKPCCTFKCSLEMFPLYKRKQCGILIYRGLLVLFPHCSLTIISNTHTNSHSTHTLFLPSTLLWLPHRILPFICNFEHILPPWKNTALKTFHLSLTPPLIFALV